MEIKLKKHKRGKQKEVTILSKKKIPYQKKVTILAQKKLNSLPAKQYFNK